MKKLATAAALLLAAAIPSPAQDRPAVDSAKIDAMIVAAFPTAPADWRPRLDQDETMKQCSMHHNLPPKAVGDAIVAREKARIEYPADGQLIGDWKKGETLAQSGYGLRFTDYPQRQAIGGNCYACHQLTKAEVSYGTIGPTSTITARSENSARPKPRRCTTRSTTPRRPIRAPPCRGSASTRFSPSSRPRTWWRW